MKSNKTTGIFVDGAMTFRIKFSPIEKADECVYGGKGYGCWKHAIDGQSDTEK